MTEDKLPKIEIHVEYRNYKAIARGNSWLEVLTQARVANRQMRIAELTCQEITYDFIENQWNLQIPVEIKPARNRIALLTPSDFSNKDFTRGIRNTLINQYGFAEKLPDQF